MRFALIASFFALFFLGSTSILSAQISGVDLSEKLTVRIIPEFPKPNELVTIRISSPSYNLDSATIAWTDENGSIIQQGIGAKEASLRVGDVGEINKINISVVLLGGIGFEKQILINPSSVDFIWEAKTYTPPFYKGKALFTPESNLVVTAIPRMSSANGPIDPKNMVYKWTKNRQVLNNQSGYGKQSLDITGSFWGRDEVVSVEVTSRDGSVRSKGSVTISPQNPAVLVYEDNPLLGVLFNRAIGVFNLNQNNEVTFFAAPFYFSSDSLSDGQTQYTWSMNGGIIPGNENGNSITFRAETDQSGTSLVGIKVRQDEKSEQKGETQFSINFK